MSRLTLAITVLVAMSSLACKEEAKPSAAPASSSPKAVKPATTLPNFDELVKLDDPKGAARAEDASAATAANAPLGADAEAAPAAMAQGSAPGASSVKLLEPGAEPRTPARYDFALDKAQTTLATVKMSAEGAMAPGMGPQPPLRLTLKITPKAKAADGNVKFALQVTKAEVVTGGAAIPPEAAKEIKAAEAAFSSMSGSFDASPRGDLSNVSLGGKGTPPELQELVAPMVELLFAPLPEEPIGVGAKWIMSTPPSKMGGMKSTFTMTARNDATADITVDTTRNAPPQPVPDPRAPKGATMEIDAKAKTKMTVRFSGIAAKVDGDQKTNVTIKDPSTTPARSQTNTILVKHSLEPK